MGAPGTSLEIILPERKMDLLCSLLVDLTAEIDKRRPDSVAHGFLGGEHGYGADYDCSAFTMRPFYWGDCDCGYEQAEYAWSKAHEHSPDCYQMRVRDDLVKRGGRREKFSATYVGKPDECPYGRWKEIEDEIRKKWCEHFGFECLGGSAVHCTCDHEPAWREWSNSHSHSDRCSLILPNFQHKASGFEVRWYKYIGRDMETVGAPPDLHAMFAECRGALP